METAHAGIETGKFTATRYVLQGFVHCRIRPTKPLFQKVDAPMVSTAKLGRPPLALASVGANGKLTHQFSLRNNQAYLIEKHKLARALVDKIETAGDKADFLHFCSTVFAQPAVSGFWRDILSKSDGKSYARTRSPLIEFQITSLD